RLDVGTTAKWGLYRTIVGASDRAPTQGVDESREPIGIVKLFGINVLGQTEVRQSAAPLLKLPNHPELVPEPVLLHRLESNCVLELGGSIIRSAPTQPLLLHVD